MRFAVETGGVMAPDRGEWLDRAHLEHLFDLLAEALVELNRFEADVAFNFETHEVDFYVVVDAPSPRIATERATDVIAAALQRAGIADEPTWDELHARRDDLVPA